MLQRLAWSLMLFTCALEVFSTWNQQTSRPSRQSEPSSIPDSTQIAPEEFPKDLNSQEKADYTINSQPRRPKQSYVSIEYCQTCSYKTLVDEISNIYIEHELEFTHPSITVIESEYPVEFPWNFLAQLFGYLRIVLMVVLLAGDWIFQTLGIVPPPIYYRAKENKIMALILVFFVSNYATSALTNTGAFEVSYQGQLIFSKLMKRRLPAVMEIISLLSSV